MSIAGKMSTTIRVSDSTPITRMSTHITATVYGRRRARRTIHIGADYRGPKSSPLPWEVNRDHAGRHRGAPPTLLAFPLIRTALGVSCPAMPDDAPPRPSRVGRFLR